MRVKFICGRIENPWAAEWFDMHHPNMTEYCARHGYQYAKDLDWQASADRIGYVGTRMEMREALRPVNENPPRWEMQNVECRFNRGGAEFSGRIAGCKHLLLEQLPDCDLLVWLGADTIVTNMTIKLEDVMPANAHVALPLDDFGYECDAVIVRNSPEGISIIQDWMSWMLNEDHPVWQNYGSTHIPSCAPDRWIAPGADPGEHGEWMRSHLFHDDAVLTAVCERYPEQAARIHPFGKKEFCIKHIRWEKGDYIIHVPGSPNDHRTSYMKMGMENVVR